jgi:hypothetical protein
MSDPSDPGSGSGNRRTLTYFGSLALLVYLATPVGFLVDIQTSFLLKNELHATAGEVALFRLVTAVPIYLAVVFGLARDHWNPLGLRDRGFLLLFAPVCAAALAWMAFAEPTYTGLLVGMLLAMVASRFVYAAYQGLIALIGQERRMSGRLSAVWMVFMFVPFVIGALVSGIASEHLPPRTALLVPVAASLVIALFALWKPASVFAGAYELPQASPVDFVASVRRLVGHRAIYPAALIVLLFNFSPGMATPLQFHLANDLHAPDSYFSYFLAISAAAFMVTAVLYGFLCTKVRLRKLLWWGTVIAIPQSIPLAFVSSPESALLLAVPIGMMGATAAAAYYDLAMRSCPPGLQGTFMMIVDGLLVLSARASDVWGAELYRSSAEHGFLYCVIATTFVYACILPVLRAVPPELTATADGEPNPDVDAEVLAEIRQTRGAST